MGRRPTADHRRRGVALAALTLLLGLVAPTEPVAAAEVPAFTGPTDGPKVGAVGDSLLGQLESEGPTHRDSTRAFTRSLNDEGWRASVKHRNAWPISRVRLLVDAELDRGAQVVIVSAGSGDVRVVRESADKPAARHAMILAVRHLLADVGDEVCVVWPTIPEVGGRGARQTARALRTELINHRHGNIRIPDWSDKAVHHPRWFLDDGVHLSRRGEAVFQQTLLTAARRCVDDLP